MKMSSDIKLAAHSIHQHFRDENFEQAEQLLDQTSAHHDHPRLTRIRARFELFKGNEAEAARLLKSILPQIWDVGAWELALAGSQAGLASVNHLHKILYFPVRKCASTSMLNVISRLGDRRLSGEEVHSLAAEQRPVPFHAVNHRFRGYFSCAVVRCPLQRVRSFYHGNVIARDHLVRNAEGRDSFYGLSTKPHVEEFVENFERYRRVFITVRNHTEPLLSFLGDDPTIYHWIGPATDVGRLIQAIGDHAGVRLEVPNEMRTPANSQSDTARFDRLMPFYSRDQQIFGRYFSES